MALFGRKKETQSATSSSLSPVPTQPTANQVADTASLARLALTAIKDGILIVDSQKLIKLINPAAIKLTGDIDADLVVGMDAGLSLQFENQNGEKISDEQNPVIHAITTNQAFESRDLVLISKDSGKKFPVEVFVIPTGSAESDRIVTIRDITKEKQEEDAQSEFISTASHEMRTPVASIEGYLGLALNPQTATIDQRAKSYLEAAHNASQHLGKLFQDLLDVTKLDDRKIQPHFRPIALDDYIKQLTDSFNEKARAKNLTLTYASPNSNRSMRVIQQPIYVFVDIDFLNEIVSNLIENAIKYTPEGKSIQVSIKSENERAIISVQDTGIGIAGSDIQHIFQKFYRADNSQTREVGGTGLGLYIVKQRTEAMNGTVWAESVYGQGSTFFISLPKLTQEEFDKRQIALKNEEQLQRAQQLKQYQEVAAFAQKQQIPQQTPQVQQSQVQSQAVQPNPINPPVNPLAQQLQYVQETPTGATSEPGISNQPAQPVSLNNPQIQVPSGPVPVQNPQQIPSQSQQIPAQAPQVILPPPENIPASPQNPIQNNQNIIQ